MAGGGRLLLPWRMGFCGRSMAASILSSLGTVHRGGQTSDGESRPAYPLQRYTGPEFESQADPVLIIVLYLKWIYPQNYKRQNGKRYKGRPNMVQSSLARSMRQGCTGPPPPLTPVLHRVAAKIKIIVSKFCVPRNFDQIIFTFAKLEENFSKNGIKNFAKLRKRKFRCNPILLHNLPSATHPPLPSARIFFNAGAAMLLWYEDE